MNYTQNFRKILDIENRKGSYLEGKFFTSIADINRKIKDTNAQIRLLKQQRLTKEIFVEKLNTLNEEKNELNELRENKRAQTKLSHKIVASAIIESNMSNK